MRIPYVPACPIHLLFPPLILQAFSFLTFIVRIAPGSRKPSPNPTGKPRGESSGEIETRPIPGLLPASTHSPHETKSRASPNEQGFTDPSGGNEVCFSECHRTATITSPPQSHSRSVEMTSSHSRHHAQIRLRGSLDQSNSSTPSFQQGSTLNDSDSSPKTISTLLGNSRNPQTDIPTGTGGETTATQSPLPLTGCPLPLGNPAEQHVGIDVQSTPPERDGGASMSGGQSQTEQPTSATPSGAPLDLKRSVPMAGHSLRQQAPQSVRPPRAAPSSNNDSRVHFNDNLSASKSSRSAGHSAHTQTSHASRSSSLHSYSESRHLISMQPSSSRSMTSTGRSEPGSSSLSIMSSHLSWERPSTIFCCMCNRQ